MKETKIRWIGCIPDSWDLKKVKQCFYISKEQAGEENPVVLSLARSGVKIRDISTNEGQLAASYDNYNPVKPGDLLLNPMDLYSGANCNMSEVSGVISPAYVNLRAKTDLNPKFFDYFFKTQYWAMAMFAHGKGVSFDNRWTMNTEAILNYWLPYPQLTTQNNIVDFLNAKLKQIDSLIEVENQQIEKLEEYKQSIITKTVTTGLKEEKKKYSGLKWVGYIPESWKLIRARYLITSYKAGPFGSSLITEKLLKEGEFLVYSPEHVSTMIFDSPKNLYLPKERKEEMEQFFVEEGDILFPIVGSLGKGMVVTKEMPSGIINQRLAKFKLDDKKVLTEYFMYLFCKSDFFKTYYDINSRGSFILNLTKAIINDMPITLPSIDEQKEIVHYLDEKCLEIETLKQLKERKIEYLEEYKKSLIFECVTGKKEVAA